MFLLRWALPAALLLLPGCQVGVEAAIRLSDVLAMRADAAPARTRLRLSFQVPSKDDCGQVGGRLTVPLPKHFGAAAYAGCDETETGTFARFDVDSEIVTAGEGLPPGESGKPVFPAVRRDGAGTHIALAAAAGPMQALRDGIPQDLRDGAGEPEFRLSAHVVNDTAGPVALMVQQVFVDGTPAPGPRRLELERGAGVTIAASDVTNAAFADGGRFVIGTLE